MQEWKNNQRERDGSVFPQVINSALELGMGFEEVVVFDTYRAIIFGFLFFSSPVLDW